MYLDVKSVLNKTGFFSCYFSLIIVIQIVWWHVVCRVGRLVAPTCVSLRNVVAVVFIGILQPFIRTRLLNYCVFRVV